jgi:hypothetical protein
VPRSHDQERWVGRVFEGLTGRRSNPTEESVDLVTLVVGHARACVVEGPAGPISPNDFTVTLAGDAADGATVRAVARDLEDAIAEAAAEQGWRLEGAPRVSFLFEPAGDLAVDAVVAPGGLTPWAVLERVAESHRVDVLHNRSIIGRSSDADVLLDNDTVSRRHALLIRRAGHMWLADLGSSNGTYLNGAPVGDPVEVVGGDVLGFGDVSYTFRPESQQ